MTSTDKATEEADVQDDGDWSPYPPTLHQLDCPDMHCPGCYVEAIEQERRQ